MVHHIEAVIGVAGRGNNFCGTRVFIQTSTTFFYSPETSQWLHTGMITIDNHACVYDQISNVSRKTSAGRM
jgi:hypothetical protein